MQIKPFEKRVVPSIFGKAAGSWVFIPFRRSPINNDCSIAGQGGSRNIKLWISRRGNSRHDVWVWLEARYWLPFWGCFPWNNKKQAMKQVQEWSEILVVENLRWNLKSVIIMISSLNNAIITSEKDTRDTWSAYQTIWQSQSVVESSHLCRPVRSVGMPSCWKTHWGGLANPWVSSGTIRLENQGRLCKEQKPLKKNQPIEPGMSIWNIESVWIRLRQYRGV